MTRRLLTALIAAFLILPAFAGAQVPSPITYGDGRRAQATRAELEATLAEISRITASQGFSSRMREARQREADLIRERLTNGDLQVGDQITLTVLGETRFTGPFLVGPGRVLSLPGIPDIPLSGVLRSEAQSHLATEIGKQLRDPQVQVQTNIRIAITGAVGKGGFYQAPADMMPTDAIMTLAGGYASNADLNRTTIRRQGREIWTAEAFQDALLRGMTLDQLNMRTGDELVVQAQRSSKGKTIMAVLGAVSTLSFLLWRLGGRF